jgi:hypothetical protein
MQYCKILPLRRGRTIETEGTLSMKTTTLIACLVTGLLTLGQPVQAASKPATALSRTTSFEHGNRAHDAHRPATLSERDVSGVIPRTIRGGDPLQMLNPRAPAKYGTTEENVLLDSDVPGKGNGIKFFSISF